MADTSSVNTLHRRHYDLHCHKYFCNKDPTGWMVCVAVHKKGALEVVCPLPPDLCPLIENNPTGGNFTPSKGSASRPPLRSEPPVGRSGRIYTLPGLPSTRYEN